MDWLVKYVTLRNLIVVVVGGAILRFAVYHRHPAIYWVKRQLYPPQGAAPASGQDILADLDRQEAARVQARYRRLMAQLEEARARGFDVDALERKAQAAASLKPEYRRQALRLLGEVEMSVPKVSETPAARTGG